MMMQPYTMVNSPPVLLEEGTTGTSTIYTNKTSAKVNIIAPIWLSGWQYRKAHVINSASAAGTNYQIRIKVHYENGTDGGEDVYLNSHSRTDFGDVRFTDNDGVTELDYWMETKVDSDYAVFWVEVADDLSADNVTIYIYYGKSGALTTSNGENTFPFFDDCSMDKSSSYIEDTTLYYSAAGTLTKNATYYRLMCGTADRFTWRRISGFSLSQFLIRTRFRMYSAGEVKNVQALTGRIVSSSQSWVGRASLYTGFATYHGILQVGTSSWYEEGYNSNLGLVENTWYWMETMFGGGQILSKLYSSAWSLISNRSYSVSAISANPVIAIFADTTSDYIDWDFIFVRKYVYPEPSHEAWGSEESGSNYDYVLKVVNQVSDNWIVNLQVYDSSNIGRLLSLNISLYDGTSSNQIAISDGSIIKYEGEQYDLQESPGSTLYISVSNLQTNISGTSYLHVYLKIQVPGKSTCLFYIITFEIT
jgi:hypothetical protein